jgi:hypothetical protein
MARFRFGVVVVVVEDVDVVVLGGAAEEDDEPQPVREDAEPTSPMRTPSQSNPTT